ncbi:hypothetical protein DsansV1_C06g0062931 [Dioscorea sansibarensis]
MADRLPFMTSCFVFFSLLDLLMQKLRLECLKEANLSIELLSLAEEINDGCLDKSVMSELTWGSMDKINLELVFRGSDQESIILEGGFLHHFKVELVLILFWNFRAVAMNQAEISTWIFCSQDLGFVTIREVVEVGSWYLVVYEAEVGF